MNWSNDSTKRIFEDLFSELNIVDDIDGDNLLDDGHLPSVETVEKWANMYAHRQIFKSSKAKSYAERWAMEFLKSVNWTEISEYLIEEATQ